MCYGYVHFDIRITSIEFKIITRNLTISFVFVWRKKNESFLSHKVTRQSFSSSRDNKVAAVHSVSVSSFKEDNDHLYRQEFKF